MNKILIALIGLFLLSPFTTQAMQTEASLHEIPPVLLAIIECESSGRQRDKNGRTLRSETDDLGLFQINEPVHGERAKELGFDLHTGRGNLAYGLLLYKENGLRDWKASKHCWGKKIGV